VVRTRWGCALAKHNAGRGVGPKPETELLCLGLGHADEPHGSLFVYFHIFAPLADDHVIVSHVTGVTRPIPTFGDQF
jgi:hypothetical protein